MKKEREIRVDGEIAYVSLTRGFTAVIDASDVCLVAGRNWIASVEKCGVYARTNTPRPVQKKVAMHRLITSAADGVQVDHIDGDGLNNRRANLRIATASQNSQNRKKPANNSSGFKGVYWNKRDGKWLARIMTKGVRVQLGYFDSAEQAHAAYVDASNRFHGEFGRSV